jgi:hypothetical protein
LVTLPPDTDVSTLTPTVVVSPLAGYMPTGPQDFTNSVATPVEYTVTAESGATQTYQVTISVASRPPNDEFVNAIELLDSTGTRDGTGTLYATFQADEPTCWYPEATNTVWFKWTAPSNGTYTLSTLGSTNPSNGEWDSVVGVYTGTSLADLVLVTLIPPVGRDTTGNPQDTWADETVSFVATADTTYYFQMAGDSGDPPQDAANILLTWSFVGSGDSYADWAATNAPGQTPDQDYNNDGVANGVAYFMGATGLATNPGVVDGMVSWPMSATFSGTYEVQTSPDLSKWTPVDLQPTPVDGSLTYTLPTDAGKLFVRLLVMPN